ncbi:hypothetical protein [Phocaeicola sp.]|uniref:hypothetical protein n=1 Tax=Phocaeicola sp. TaxID=2773926 RepID=UPI003A911772
MTKRFYKRLYAELVYPEIESESRGKKVKELEDDKELYDEFLQWVNSSENIEKKNQLYINDFVAVFGRFPEGWTLERQQEVPDPEKFISSKSGADRKSPTV